MEKRRNFWRKVANVGGAIVAISGAILGLPVLIPALVIPASIILIASYAGGIGTLAVVVAKQIDPAIQHADESPEN